MASNSGNANKVLTRTKGQIGPEIALAAYAKGSEGVWKLKCFLGCVGAASGINARKFMMTAMVFKIIHMYFLYVLGLYIVKVMARPRF